MNLPNFGQKEITNKIKNIRSTYSQELKKIKDSTASGAGTDSVYIPSLKWFPILDAVLRSANIETRTSHSNLEEPETETNTDVSGPVTNVDDELASSDRASRPPLQQLTKKRKLKDIDAIMKKIKDVSERVNTSVPNEHEFDIFGKSVAAQLKALPLKKALEAQQSIQSYINKLRLQHVSSIDYVPSPSPSPSAFYVPSSSSSQTTRISFESPEETTQFDETWQTSTSTFMHTPAHGSEAVSTPHSTQFMLSPDVSTVQESQHFTGGNILATAMAIINDNCDP